MAFAERESSSPEWLAAFERFWETSYLYHSAPWPHLPLCPLPNSIHCKDYTVLSSDDDGLACCAYGFHAPASARTDLNATARYERAVYETEIKSLFW